MMPLPGMMPAPMRGPALTLVAVLALALTLLCVVLFGDAGRVPVVARPPPFHKDSLGLPMPHWPEPVVEYSEPPPRFTPSVAYPTKLRVLITGGAGFIGSQLGYDLHRRGHDVVLVDNMMFGYRDNLVVDGKRFGTFVLGDVMDPRIARFFDGVDVVFHFAALSALPVCQSQPRDAMAVNVGGVANVLEASRRAGVGRFIFASTSAVYESNTEAVLTEDLAVSPHLLYSLSKYQAELLVRGVAATNGIDTVVLRFFNVYGPHQDFRRKSPPFTSYVIRELVAGRRPVLHSTGEQMRDYVHVDDLMRLASLCMTHPKARGETFNVASGEPVSVNAMYEIIAKALNSTIRPTYRDASHFWDAYASLFSGRNPIRKAVLEAEVTKRTVGSFGKAQRMLGWKPRVTVNEGLTEMVRYVQRSRRMAGAGGGATTETAW